MKYIFVVLLWTALISVSFTDKMFASAHLYPNGTFSCDPNNLDLEKAGYKHIIGFLNGGVLMDEKLNLTEQQLHDNLVEATGATGHNSLDLYKQERLCLSNNGIDPDSVATFYNATITALNYGTVPEFSSAVGLVAVVAIMSVIIITRKF